MKNLLKKAYYVYEDLMDGDVLNKNKILKNAYDGKRCFILCTGASLNALDLKMLNNEYTYGCNYLYKHRDGVPFSFIHRFLAFRE